MLNFNKLIKWQDFWEKNPVGLSESFKLLKEEEKQKIAKDSRLSY